MGTWGEGLYDNDSALDELAGLVAPRGDEANAEEWAVALGLALWLDPALLKREATPLLEKLEGDESSLPEEARAVLRALREDREALLRKRSRSEALHALLGGYSDGPREDALVGLAGGRRCVESLGERCAQRMDALREGDLYEAAAELAALGVLLELHEAGLWSPAEARVAAWRAGFERIDEATKEERGFWWRYVRRVYDGLARLAPSTEAPPPAVPRGGKKPAREEPPAGPLFRHAKFGVGALLSRSGAGDTEVLELRFEDGVVRKIAARFLEPAG